MSPTFKSRSHREVKPRDEWFARQLLPPRADVGIRAILRRAGWMNSAGGTGPYLAFRARNPAVTRRDVDAAAFRSFDIVEVPAVRDSMMLVPRDDIALALAAGRRSFGERLAKIEKACGVTRNELDILGDRIMRIVEHGVRTLDGLRAELPAKYIRDLGEAGKKFAFASTLPIALRILQTEGRIIRLAEELQLDGKRHSYRAWPDAVKVGDAPKDLDRALAERFTEWASPASVDEFATWAGIGKTAAKRVLPISASAVQASPATGTFLLPFRDNYFALHRGLTAFTDTRGVTLLDFSNKPKPLESLDSLHHNAIVVDGELCGIWEYDRAEERVVWKMFSRVDVSEAVAQTDRFIRDELGDHKFYAVDHTRSRDLRLQFVAS